MKKGVEVLIILVEKQLPAMDGYVINNKTINKWSYSTCWYYYVLNVIHDDRLFIYPM